MSVLQEHPVAISSVAMSSAVTLVVAIQVTVWLKTENHVTVSCVHIERISVSIILQNITISVGAFSVSWTYPRTHVILHFLYTGMSVPLFRASKDSSSYINFMFRC